MGGDGCIGDKALDLSDNEGKESKQVSDESDKAYQPGAEKREFPRVDAKIEVGFRTGDEFALCYSRNISRGGMFVETSVLPDPNAHVHLVLDLTPFLDDSESETKFEIQARVVRLMTVNEDGKEIHKIAVQFVDLPPQIQLKLDRLYSELANEDQ